MGIFDGALEAVSSRLNTLTSSSPFKGQALGGANPFNGSAFGGSSPFQGNAFGNGGTAFGNNPFGSGGSPFGGNAFGNGASGFGGNPFGGGGSPFGGNPFGGGINPYMGTESDPFGTGKPGLPKSDPTGNTVGGDYSPSTYTGDQAAAWVTQTRAGSPLAAIAPQIVAYARSKGVDPGMLFGVLLKESQLAADNGMGTRQNNPGNIMAPGADPASGRIILRSYGSMLEGVQAMVDLFANYGSLYGAKSVEDMIAVYYVGPEAYKKYGLDANDAGGSGAGGNGTVRDYLAKFVYPTMQTFGAQKRDPLAVGNGTKTKSGRDLGQLLGMPGVAVSQEIGDTDYSNANPYNYGADFGLGSGHHGLDLGFQAGTQMKSPVSGTVIYAGGTGYYKDERYGNAPGTGELRIRLDNGHEIILGHMGQINVRVGQRITAGQAVGLSGVANGAHLHLEYRIPDKTLNSGWRAVDPRQYL